MSRSDTAVIKTQRPPTCVYQTATPDAADPARNSSSAA
jgi:hypothetical protein